MCLTWARHTDHSRSAAAEPSGVGTGVATGLDALVAEGIEPLAVGLMNIVIDRAIEPSEVAGSEDSDQKSQAVGTADDVVKRNSIRQNTT